MDVDLLNIVLEDYKNEIGTDFIYQLRPDLNSFNSPMNDHYRKRLMEYSAKVIIKYEDNITHVYYPIISQMFCGELTKEKIKYRALLQFVSENIRNLHHIYSGKVIEKKPGLYHGLFDDWVMWAYADISLTDKGKKITGPVAVINEKGERILKGFNDYLRNFAKKQF